MLIFPKFLRELLWINRKTPEGLTLDSDNWKATKLPPDGRLRRSLDRRTYILPAGFRWGNCLVTVVPESQVPRRAQVVDGHSDAGAMLQFKAWPHARKAANEIVKRCLPVREEGGYMTEIMIDHAPIFWGVVVEYRPAKGPALQPIPPTNIYIAGSDRPLPQKLNPLP